MACPGSAKNRLIPLKAIAWLELTARKANGENVDAKDIRKHANDVIRLSQLLAPDHIFRLRKGSPAI